MKPMAFLFVVAVFSFGCKKSTQETAKVEKPVVAAVAVPDKLVSEYKVVVPSDRKWEPLFPSQPDGPKVAVVRGDRTGDGPSAFFAKIPAGESPGLHTHSETYQAIVVSGTYKHWLAGGTREGAKTLVAGDFWVQPGGKPHNDACEGKEDCVLFVLFHGKHDIALAPNATAGEVGDYKLVTAKDAKWGPFNPAAPEGPQMALFHGDIATGPFVIEFRSDGGFDAGMHSHTDSYYGLVIEGSWGHWQDGGPGKNDALPVGTYWYQPGGANHNDVCRGKDRCKIAINGIDKIGHDYIPVTQ